MRRWMIFGLLAAALVIGLAALDLNREAGETNGEKVVRLATYTPTLTHTPGWWEEAATWTPTPTGESAAAGEATRAVEATTTPALNIPPVSTFSKPAAQPGGAP